MNLNSCRIALRPRGPLEVFDLCTRLLRAHPRRLAQTAAWSCLPWVLLALPLCWWFEGHPALLALPLLLAAPIQALFTLLGGKLLFAAEVPERELLSSLWQRRGPLLLAWAVGAIGWVLTLLTCGGLALVAQPALLFNTETALLEGEAASTAVSRAMRLASGHIGIALFGAVARWGLTAWMVVVMESGAQGLTGFVLQLGLPFGALQDGIVTPWVIAGVVLAQPLIALYRLLLYVDLRTRLEGWDLQAALMAAGQA